MRTKLSVSLVPGSSGFPYGRCSKAASPDSEQIEPSGVKLRRRNSESLEEIQDNPSTRVFKLSFESFFMGFSPRYAVAYGGSTSRKTIL